MATALHLNGPDLALEWLEQGRCLVWNQINKLHTPIDNLRTKSPSLADRFIKVASALEFYGTRSILSIPSSHKTLAEEIHLQDDNQNHTLHAAQYRQLLDEIRSLPDFDNFLRPPKVSNLLSSLPSDGTVITFNILNTSCDALALKTGICEPLHIPLKDFSFVEAEKLQKMLQFNVLKQGGVEDPGRAGGIFPNNLAPMSFILKELWQKIVQPILEALGYFVRCCLLSIYRYILIFCTLNSRSPQIPQIALVYGGAQLVHSHFFHSMQLAYMVQSTGQDHASPILWFHRTHPLSVPSTINSPYHLPLPEVQISSLLANQKRQVLGQYLRQEKRHAQSKP